MFRRCMFEQYVPKRILNGAVENPEIPPEFESEIIVKSSQMVPQNTQERPTENKTLSSATDLVMDQLVSAIANVELAIPTAKPEKKTK